MTFGIMSWSLVLAVLGALLLGGTFRPLAGLRIRLWWVLVLALAFKLALLLSHAPPIPWAQPLIFLLVAVGAIANWRLPGVLLVAAGLLMNVVVVAANGWVMPFSTGAYSAAGRPLDPATHEPRTSALSQPEGRATALAWLDDRIPFPPTRQIVSLGDVFIMAGGVWLIVAVSGPRRLPSLLKSPTGS